MRGGRIWVEFWNEFKVYVKDIVRLGLGRYREYVLVKWVSFVKEWRFIFVFLSILVWLELIGRKRNG